MFSSSAADVVLVLSSPAGGLPVLRLARNVTLLTVVDDKPGAPIGLADVRDWLQFHGITTVELSVTRGEQPVGDVIQEAALKADAGLLVMGGFGRGRLREFVLGGATRSALHNPRLPIFMSH